MAPIISMLYKKETFVLLYISMLGYGLALSHEIGYSIYFSYDIEFIQIDAKSIYYGIVQSAAFFLLYLAVLCTLKQTKTNDKLKTIQIIIYLGIIFLFITPWAPKNIFTNVISTFILFATLSILIAIYYFLAKKDAFAIPVLCGIGTLLIFSLSVYFGLVKASSESLFNAFKYDNSEYVIIRIYNGNIVGIKLEGKELSKTEHIYIPAAQVKPLILKELYIESKPGTASYKDEYPKYPERSLGRLIYNNDK
ncbi:hypothetical protein ACY18M_07855 [Proteus mirabilis]|uniref:hypothetical protein n=1 Tax=Proteus mirabilis TaxID=584 RepID=UPI00113FE5BD|nr:hypothetical protein [Proteus mirabilis]MBG6017789.1 hypothetical protein [Proteus mirabilis]MBI6403094.1 hypothetical protein [Proteus mirabilis]MCT0095581.1 hypothetical protein [Proteus mirabilis]MDC9756033.1 hypothetical protein [Proteus mirabilis]MDF7132418.1 hypothetical protein [Proteus mirabilis]